MKGEAFIKMPAALVTSPAWRALGINARRLIDVLIAEHMSHGGKKNGYLVAPRSQLKTAGISARHVSGAIEEINKAGIVDIKRGFGRQCSTFTLNWLPLPDGTAPNRRWMSKP